MKILPLGETYSFPRATNYFEKRWSSEKPSTFNTLENTIPMKNLLPPKQLITLKNTL
jgi:hypothetical protein